MTRAAVNGIGQRRVTPGAWRASGACGRSGATRAPGVRRAFTMIEMVTSCLVLSVLMVALGYGLKLALVSTGQGATHAVASLEAAGVVERVADDMSEAIAFSERTATAVTFSVPDRGNDGKPDQIRYQWWPTAGSITIAGTGSSGSSGSGSSGGTDGGGGLLGGLLGAVGGLLGGGGGTSGGGTSGGTDGSGTSTDTVIPVPQYTLTARVDGGDGFGDVAVLARDVRAFDLNFLTRAAAPAAAPAGTSDRLLFAFEGGGLLSSSSDYGVTASRGVGQTILPSSRLPGGTTSFTVTRIQVAMKLDGTPDGLLRLSVRPAVTSGGNVNKPQSNATILSGVYRGEVSMSSVTQWVEFTFASPVTLNASTKYSFVVQGVSGTSNHGVVTVVSGGDSNTWGVKTTDGGASWSLPPVLLLIPTYESILYRVYGTTTP